MFRIKEQLALPTFSADFAGRLATMKLKKDFLHDEILDEKGHSKC